MVKEEPETEQIDDAYDQYEAQVEAEIEVAWDSYEDEA